MFLTTLVVVRSRAGLESAGSEVPLHLAHVAEFHKFVGQYAKAVDFHRGRLRDLLATSDSQDPLLLASAHHGLAEALQGAGEWAAAEGQYRASLARWNHVCLSLCVCFC